MESNCYNSVFPMISSVNKTRGIAERQTVVKKFQKSE